MASLEAAADDLEAISQRGPRRPPGKDHADYLAVLSVTGPLRAVRVGPLYVFPESMTEPGAATFSAANAHLLRGGLEWLSDVGGPIYAMIVEGEAVSVCGSVAASRVAHAAFVHTRPGYRSLAVQAVSAWARAVRSRGAIPFYGTTFDNIASQSLARRLGLSLVGSEFSVELAVRE